MADEQHDGYEVRPFPKMRRFSIDAGRLGRGKHIIHGLLELDVTRARQAIRDHRARTGETLSFTGFVIACLARAIEAHKEVHAQRNWRNQLVIFDEVNVNTMIEVEAGGRKVPMPYIIRAANRKSFREIHDEIRATQARPAKSGEFQFMRWFLSLPWPLRRLFYWFVTRNPRLMRRYSTPVLVTSLGMFGEGAWWGIPMPNFSLTVTLGGIVERPGVVDGRIEVREVLCATVSLDHDIIDGAPAARFGREFKDLVEGAYGLVD